MARIERDRAIEARERVGRLREAVKRLCADAPGLGRLRIELKRVDLLNADAAMPAIQLFP